MTSKPPRPTSPPGKLSLCTRLVGRAPEVELLDQQLRRVFHQAQVVIIGGEAGIGKTRLVSEVQALAHERAFTFLRGDCFEPYRRLPYAPLVDLLRNQIAAQATPPPQALSSELLSLLPEFSPLGKSSRPPEPEQQKRRLFQALFKFLTQHEPSAPHLLLIEDLHWSDEPSLEFLLYLARQISSQPILLLLTYRTDEANPALSHFLAELERQRLATEIVLHPLSRSQIGEMISSIFELKEPVRADFLERMYVLTDGNPFFLEETLKSLITAGEIFYANAEWQRKPVHELNIARSVQDAVQRRTEQLGAAAQQVLALAAVVGRRFDFELLKGLAGMTEQELVPLLKQLIEAQLVVEDSADRFAFRHALTRETVYGSLLRRERKRMHQSVGETMERVHAADLGLYVADLAYHYHAAGAWSKALEYSQRAGEMAQALYAPHEAIEQYSRALEAAEQLSSSVTVLLHARGQAYETIGAFDSARADYERALELAQRAADAPAHWQALIDLGFLWSSRDYARTGDYFQEALTLARAMDDLRTLAHTLNRIGNWYVNLDQPQAALAYHQEALAIFRTTNDRNGTAETLDLLGLTNEIDGNLRQAHSDLTESVAHFRALGNQPRLVSSLAELSALGESYLGNVLVTAELSLAKMLELGEQARTLARQIGLRSGEAYASSLLGVYHGYYGEYDRALELAHESLRLTEEIEHVQWNCLAHTLFGWLYLDLYALDAAQKEGETALSLAQQIGSSIFLHCTSEALARTYMAQHDLDRADAVLTPALGANPFDSMTYTKRLAIAAWGELALAKGDAQRAVEIADELVRRATNLTPDTVIPRLWLLRGSALTQLNRFDEAEALLDAARADTQARGVRPMLWRIHRALGKLYQLQDRRKEASVEYSAARAIIQTLAESMSDATLRATFLQGAEASLPRPRQHTPGRVEKARFGGLTAREREIAGLLAKGKSNREIAVQLVLSERTVGAHIASILGKLGFGSRTQVAVWAVENGLTHE